MGNAHTPPDLLGRSLQFKTKAGAFLPVPATRPQMTWNTHELRHPQDRAQRPWCGDSLSPPPPCPGIFITQSPLFPSVLPAVGITPQPCLIQPVSPPPPPSHSPSPPPRLHMPDSACTAHPSLLSLGKYSHLRRGSSRDTSSSKPSLLSLTGSGPLHQSSLVAQRPHLPQPHGAA